MTDVDAIARLLELGANAVFLMLLWRVYQDFIAAVNRHANYLERLVDKHVREDETMPQAFYRGPDGRPYTTNSPTELREREQQRERVGI